MISNEKPVVVIGSANMDLVTRVETFPRPGQTIAGAELEQHPGGKGANQAVAAARAHAKVSFIGNIGHGIFGDALIEDLAGKGIDLKHVARSKDLPAGTAVILLDERGENQIVVTHSSNNLVSPAQIQKSRSLIRQAGILVLQREIPDDAVTAAITLAQRHGVPVLLNPAPASRPLPKQLLSKVTWLTPNETEVAVLSGMPVKRPRQIVSAARTLLATGLPNVVVTCGAQGACWVSQRQEKAVWFPARQVKVVDTVGAGDCFSGTLAAGLCRGLPPEKAIRVAVEAATRKVQRVGAQA